MASPALRLSGKDPPEIWQVLFPQSKSIGCGETGQEQQESSSGSRRESDDSEHGREDRLETNRRRGRKWKLSSSGRGLMKSQWPVREYHVSAEDIAGVRKRVQRPGRIRRVPVSPDRTESRTSPSRRRRSPVHRSLDRSTYFLAACMESCMPDYKRTSLLDSRFLC